MSETAAALAAALLLDAAFGEPKALWSRAPHPVVLMGRAIGAADRRLNRGGARRAKGALALAALALAAGAFGWALASAPGIGPVLGALLGAALLAQNSLAAHVRAVGDALAPGEAAGADPAAREAALQAARGEAAKIVGRDPESLDAAGAARAAIESAAENFSDGVAAPAFWFLVAGPAGLVVYKLVNTADSMIGHRTPRHEAFGWAAARLDDLLNLAPARLSALLIAAAAGSPRALRAALRDARRHRSPNAGWPEAAMAGALDLSLAGPRRYGGAMTEDAPLNPGGRRAAGAADVAAAVRLIWRAWALMLAGIVALAALG